MKIAIIGAGFCGLAVAWNIAACSNHDVVIFDSTPVGKGTSGIATGLFHAYAGAHSKKNLRADEGVSATHELIRVSEQALGSSVINSKGILRLALTEEQKKDFSACAATFPDVHWHTADECQRLIPAASPHPGIFIESGISIECKAYLQGLWLACQRQGAHFEQRHISTLAELDDFDRVIVTAGAKVKSLPELSMLPVTPIKGQLLEVESPETLPVLPCALNSQAYIVSSNTPKQYIIGATFERHFDSLEPNQESAISEIMPKAIACLPAIYSAKILHCRAGVRASTPGHRPLLRCMDKRTWVLTGMGSKGLLYHALYAKELVNNL